MKILKRENWWIWLLLMLFGSGTEIFVLAALLDCYKKGEWYSKAKYWLIGLACFIIPFFIMIMVFYIQMLCRSAAKLKVSGSEIYLSPYIWLIALIVPIFGWIFIAGMAIYLHIFCIVALHNGNGDVYAEK